MFRIRSLARSFCNAAEKKEYLSKIRFTEKQRKSIDFKELRYPSKVPAQPITQDFESNDSVDAIDAKTIQLLERLALVDLDSRAALETLNSSVQFANKILHINTDGVEPMYTVLEGETLRLRKDQVTEGDDREAILRNAKVTDEDYFVAPPGNIPLDQEEKKF